MANMFCFQCQETAKGTGCTVRGVCGKLPETNRWMDLLLSVVRGVGTIYHALLEDGANDDVKVDDFLIDALFATITNANFDDNALLAKVDNGIAIKKLLLAEATCPEAVARNRPLWLARHRTCTTAVPGWLDMTLAAAVRDAGADPGWGASLKAARMPRLPGDRDALVQCLAGLVVVRADITDPSDARTAMAEAVRREIGEG